MNNHQSPFIALLVVFLALGASYGIQMKQLITQRHDLKKMEANLIETMPQVKVINDRLRNVGQDLITLAATDPVARQLLNEFNIRAAPAK